MEKHKILLKISTILKKNKVFKNFNLKEIKKINIFEDERIDSLKLMRILSEIERKFELELNMSFFRVKKNQTIDKISQILSNKIK
jgi:acyl carrier protein|tara:strand:+ start:777 stop:1031 length:255 start_codon:yes stop_codon:yes gene_type:complete